MTRSPVTLSVDTLLTITRWRHGEPHPVVSYTPTWYDDTTLRVLDARARAELTHHGLMHGDRLDPDFNDVLGALMRPCHELYGWITAMAADRPRHYGVLAGFAYQQGFLLVHEHGTNAVLLTPVGLDQVLDSFLAQLPPARPANQSGITVDYEEFLAATRKRERSGRRASVPPEVRALRALLAQPRPGAGNLYSAARGSSGARARILRPVNYLDTPDGRWLLTLYTEHGRRWVTARPATRALITSWLTPMNTGYPVTEILLGTARPGCSWSTRLR
jgi:hypothetical protein